MRKLVASLHGYQPLEWIRLGIPALDLIMGAGIPRSRMIEIVGDPATAKSAIGCAAIAAFQRAGGIGILLDTERKIERSWAEMLGVDWGSLGYDSPDDIPAVLKIIGRIAQTAMPKTPTVVVWDSIAATRGVEELEEVTEEEDWGGEKASRARHLSKGLRAILGKLQQRGVTLIAINQLRSAFSFTSGYSGLESPGGRAVKYHSALRLMVRPRGRIKDRVRDVVTGIAVEVEAIKNTCSAPFRKATLRFRFESGWDRWSGLDELLIRHGRIVQAAGWLRYRDRKFRSSELESVASEYPDLVAPIKGVIEPQEADSTPPETENIGIPSPAEGPEGATWTQQPTLNETP